MAYVLIIVMYVAMGGPKDTTPTIDHIQFSSQQNCEKAKTALVSVYRLGPRVEVHCYPQ